MTDAASWRDSLAAAATAWEITPNPFVVAACRRLRPGRALDLGAGEGGNAIWLAGRGWHVTAVDRATVSIGRIQGRSALLNRPVDAIVADALAYQPRPDSFDLILLSYLELPEPQLRRVLGHTVPALAVGGTVLVVGCDSANLEGGWGGPQDPDLLTTPDRLAAMLTDLGLDVRRAEVVRREVASDVGFHTALDHVVEAVRSAA
ncbi:MAG: class I SAM-dependent methyltransferase [Propionicimonas sp.]|uniref:class I SAM-dependent methyltransferase n=1 Tax=Propionicimonas sp. TaxID=1955623 RepID=UPI003D09769A